MPQYTPRTPSAAVPPLLKHFEGGPFLTAYPDPESPRGIEMAKPLARRVPGWASLPGDPWSNGWGHTGAEVHEGLVITLQKCAENLAGDIQSAADGVNKILQDCTVTVEQGHFDAFTCFAFNEGIGSPDDHDKGLWGSTLMARFKAGDLEGAAYQFDRWIYSRGRVVASLVQRRAQEKLLFLGKPVTYATVA